VGVQLASVNFWNGASRRAHTVDGSLTAQLFKHFGGTGESVTRFADRDVEDEFLDAQLPHGVAGLVALFAGLEKMLTRCQLERDATLLPL
jgi:hypothetical protein